MLYKSKILTLITIVYSKYVYEYWIMGQRGRFYLGDCCLGQVYAGIVFG